MNTSELMDLWWRIGFAQGVSVTCAIVSIFAFLYGLVQKRKLHD